MFERFRRGWGLTKKAWGVIRSHPSLAKLPLIGGALALVVFAVVGVPGALLLGGDGSATQITGVVLLAVGSYLASFTIIYFNVALAAGGDQALRGEQPDIARAKQVARSRIGSIAAWALVSVIVSVLLNLLRDRGTVILRSMASIGAAIWGLITFLVVPVLAFEGIGPIAAIRRSTTLVRDRWGEQVAGNVVIGGISSVAVLLGFLVGIGGAALLIAGETSMAVLGGVLILVGVVVAIGGAVFGGATRGVFGVALYRYIADDAVLAPFTATDLAAAARTE
jgi:hypothetical protein